MFGHEIYMIRHISAKSKDRDFWFGPQNSLNLCAKHLSILGVFSDPGP